MNKCNDSPMNGLCNILYTRYKTSLISITCMRIKCIKGRLYCTQRTTITVTQTMTRVCCVHGSIGALPSRVGVEDGNRVVVVVVVWWCMVAALGPGCGYRGGGGRVVCVRVRGATQEVLGSSLAEGTQISH